MILLTSYSIFRHDAKNYRPYVDTSNCGRHCTKCRCKNSDIGIVDVATAWLLGLRDHSRAFAGRCRHHEPFRRVRYEGAHRRLVQYLLQVKVSTFRRFFQYHAGKYYITLKISSDSIHVQIHDTKRITCFYMFQAGRYFWPHGVRYLLKVSSVHVQTHDTKSIMFFDTY